MKVHPLGVAAFFIIGAVAAQFIQPRYVKIAPPKSDTVIMKIDTHIKMYGSLDGLNYFTLKNDTVIYKGEYKVIRFVKP